MLNMNISKAIDCGIHFFGIIGALHFISGFFIESDLLSGAIFAVAALATLNKANKK